MTNNCRVCSVELNSDNWNISQRKHPNYICKSCEHEKARLWRKANHDKLKVAWTKSDRKHGHRPFYENRDCPSFLGVHIAERVLSNVFKDVERMPMNNPGYDFICSKDKKIDVKSSSLWKDGSWGFGINHNTIADYFLCLAFDNRKDLNPLHIWLLPGSKFSHFVGAAVRPSTVHKWNKYMIHIEDILRCCNTIRGV